MTQMSGAEANETLMTIRDVARMLRIGERTADLPDVDTWMGQVCLTPAEAGTVLRVSEDTVRNLHRLKQLPGILVGRRLLFTPRAITRYVEALEGNCTP